MRFSGVEFWGWWYLYDEQAKCIAKARQRRDRKLEVTANGCRAVYFYQRDRDTCRVTKGNDLFLEGRFFYQTDKQGKTIQEASFRPPMPLRLDMGIEGEYCFSLHQRVSREMELYCRGELVGIIRHMLRWKTQLTLQKKPEDGTLLILLLFLAKRLLEDDTVLIV
ncbi:hypothetical protein MCG98_11700 [Ruminococcus sp. OA3]|uniref:hypothetical protein n=1 Tax=Ruminococcus sp. OA3 TaxID=2914164 RepID=UPI001F068E91|nr:hypothetical protein [Ruminococcus sp. OA3]MCH1983229.1 hypothetical protein [Ruminococcus sp. OA3]